MIAYLPNGDYKKSVARPIPVVPIAWSRPAKHRAARMVARAEGDLSERARQRAADLANDADLRTTVPKASRAAPVQLGGTATTSLRVAPDDRLTMPGQEITREYKGQTLVVRVLANGFEFEGEVYKSLSAVAKAITDQHCNGYLFFRLGGQGGAK